MKLLHVKSPCCRGEIRRFGSRRRQCVICHKTWRIRKKRRGRKRILVKEDLAIKFFQKRLPPLRIVAENKNRSKDVIQLLLNRSLRRYINNHGDEWLKRLENFQYLIAVADAIWYRVRGERYTIYVILLRGVDTHEAVICPPIIIKGHEGVDGWQKAFEAVPKHLKNRILALISDGAGSLLSIIKPKGWIIQRCHFHMIASVQNYLTIGPRSVNQTYALEVMRLVQQVLQCHDQRKLNKLVQKVEVIRNQSKSRGLRRVLGGLMKDLSDFHAYLKFPRLNLPTTSNTAESFIQCIRDLMYRCRGFRSLPSLQTWLMGIAIFKKTVRCNGKNQPN